LLIPSRTAGKLVSSTPDRGGAGLGALSGDRTISVSGRTGAIRVERRAGTSLGVEAGGVSPVAEAGGGWATACNGPNTLIARASVAIPVNDTQSLAMIIIALECA